MCAGIFDAFTSVDLRSEDARGRHFKKSIPKKFRAEKNADRFSECADNRDAEAQDGSGHPRSAYPRMRQGADASRHLGPWTPRDPSTFFFPRKKKRSMKGIVLSLRCTPLACSGVFDRVFESRE